MKIYLSRFCKKKRTPPFIENYCHSSSSVKAFKISPLQNKNAKLSLSKIACVLLVTLFQLTYAAYAQNITLKKSHASLESVFKNIEGQSKYVFFYKKAEIARITDVTVDIKSIPLEQALAGILKGYNLEYQIFDKTIAIKKAARKEPNNPADTIQKKAAILLRGRVVDENQSPIKYVTIREPKLGFAMVTDADGQFKFQGGISGYITLAAQGFEKRSIAYSDTTFLDIMLRKAGGNKVIDLNEVVIKSNEVKEQPTRFIDLENRNYMNLSQILQGTIPAQKP